MGWRRGLAAAALVLMAITVLPVVVLRWVNPPTTAFMVERRVEGALDPSRRVAIAYRWADLEEISDQVCLAVVAAEDQRFLEHRGFDLDSIRDALGERRARGRIRGASTLSQQVAKNLFLWPGRSFLRKGLEAAFTILLESLWPKRRILEVYLNTAEFGNGVYGVDAASRRFFGVPPARLSRHQAALLATVLPNPRRFRADSPSPYVRHRARWIERQMGRMGSHYLDSL